MSYYVTHENSILNINNAHLKVSGNVHTDVLKLGAMEFAPPVSDVPGTVNFTNVTTGVTTTSNLNVGGTLMLGSVELATSTSALEQTVNLGNTTSNTVQFTNPTTGLVATGNVETQGKFIGDGSALTGISSTLQAITDSGNVTSNTIQFSNAITGFVTTANVEVGAELTVSGSLNFGIPNVHSDSLSGSGSISAATEEAGYAPLGNDMYVVWGNYALAHTGSGQYDWTWYFPNNFTMTVLSAVGTLRDCGYGYSYDRSGLGINGYYTNRIAGHTKNNTIGAFTQHIHFVVIGKKV